MSNARREAIRREVNKTSRDKYILDQMKKLGFWPSEEDRPSLPEQFIEKETALNQELRELYAAKQKAQNTEKVLAEMRKERIKESREKQKENKKRKQEEKAQKAKAWQDRKEREILYLGPEVSSSLNKTDTNQEKLTRNNLPVLDNEVELANFLGITVGKLRFLTFQREVSKISHYRHFEIKKKTGGTRLISAPMPQLKAAQKQLLLGLLYNLEPQSNAHGFRPDHSIVTNAKVHVQQSVVINLDLKNFFPTIEYPRVKGLYQGLGYSGKIATLLALLCTEAPVEKVSLDGETFYIQTGSRHLPQGAPTSPAITNIICKRLDARLQGLAAKYGFNYSRYADDMSFSADKSNKGNLSKLMANVRRVIKAEGFTIHPDKTRVMNNHTQQEVTGIVVNEKPNVSRKQVDKFRALLYQIEKDGIEGKHWNGSSNLLAAIRGYANFIHSVNPEKGAPLVARAEAILKEHRFKHEIKFPNRGKLAAVETKEAIKKSPSGKKKWWEFWK